MLHTPLSDIIQARVFQQRRNLVFVFSKVQDCWDSLSRNITTFLFHIVDITPADTLHDDVLKWKHFPRYWPFVREIHRSPVNSQHKGQRRGALVFFFDLRLNKPLKKNNGEAGDLRRYRAHYDVMVMGKVMSNGISSQSTWFDCPGIHWYQCH